MTVFWNFATEKRNYLKRNGRLFVSYVLQFLVNRREEQEKVRNGDLWVLISIPNNYIEHYSGAFEMTTPDNTMSIGHMERVPVIKLCVEVE